MKQDYTNRRLLYLDCSSGISGDMTVAALLDLGADADVLTAALHSLPLDGYHIEITDVIKSDLRARDFRVILAQDNHDHDMDYLHGTTHGQPHDHGHDHFHGRNLHDITTILSSGQLTPHALELALKIFRIVAEAESQVHGKPIEDVHFHEVGAVDSIVDIAAVGVCLDNLGISRTVLTHLTEGTGQVRCQHGLLPIPVPATAAIASKYQLPLRISSVQGELVTPTGAAIAAALRTDHALPREFKILRTGLGAGKRDYATTGVLRAMLIEESAPDAPSQDFGETASVAPCETAAELGAGSFDHDTILVIETNLDDCSGETMGFVMEELLEAGALDVFYTPIYMKKHRPAYLLSVLCAEEKRPVMEELIFRHTTSIGLRVHKAQRTKLPRKIITLETPWGMADIKCCRHGDQIYYYPESDSIRLLARNCNKSYRELYYEVKNYASNHPTVF